MAETGLHRHEHAHESQPPHRHVHHHDGGPGASPHAHAHATGFERLTYISSPVHAREARAKVLAALVVIVGIVVAPPMGALEFALTAALLLAVAVIARLPLATVLRRSAIVLPVAGAIALFAPLQAGGGSLGAAGVHGTWYATVLAVVSRAWLSVLVMVLLGATTPVPELLSALRRLKVPDVFITLLSFIYRYVSVLGDQLRSMRIAMASRAPGLPRLRQLTVYGHLAGTMFVRAYERGERIHAAMLARGFDGTLPVRGRPRMRAADWLLVLTAGLTAAAIVLA